MSPPVVAPACSSVSAEYAPPTSQMPPPPSSFNPWRVLIPSMIGLLVIFGVIYAFTRNSQPTNATTPGPTLTADPNSSPVEAASPATGESEAGLPAGGTTNTSANANANADTSPSPEIGASPEERRQTSTRTKTRTRIQTERRHYLRPHDPSKRIHRRHLRRPRQPSRRFRSLLKRSRALHRPAGIVQGQDSYEFNQRLLSIWNVELCPRVDAASSGST